ncbi:MAG: AMP phosphorylase [Candidatus Micrarchaeota archaeon]|nr:AMP phosphorylase [Candidatus Micrarchaeota archaeon]
MAKKEGSIAQSKLSPKDEVWKYKKYLCKARCFDITAGGKIAVLNETEAHENDLYTSHRVILRTPKAQTVAIIDLSSDIVQRGEIVLFSEVAEELGATEGTPVEILHMQRPASIEFIKKKMDGRTLSKHEIDTIMRELMENRLSEAELASFITSIYIRGMSDDEIVALTESVVATGQTLQLGRHPICDKHCIGGVAGNRTTMVIVPIVAAAGLYIPKTSSRSITSAAGTADTMEVLADVSFNISEMREIVQKSKGCIVWGGALRLASADDKLIKIRNPLSLDPKGVLLASILAKKKSVGAENIIIDIPIGRGAKIQDQREAGELARDFINIGKRLGMKIEVLITDGSEPVGRGIGPALECHDVLSVLSGGGPPDLRDKSCQLAGALLELSGKVKKGSGFQAAEKLLSSGKALLKFREIVELQGGNRNLKPDDIPVAPHKHTVYATENGRIFHIDNKMISKIARAAGAPNDKAAGVLLLCERGDRINKGDPLFEIHAVSESKLDFAIKALEGWSPVELRKVVLSSIN